MGFKSLLMGFAVVAVAIAFAAPSQAVLDNYKCYKVKKDSIAAFPPTISDTDQFGTVTDEMKKAFLWCNPVSVNGGGIINPVDHLLCYKIKGDQFDPNPHLSTTNQFGNSTLFAKKPFLLCIPGSKAILP